MLQCFKSFLASGNYDYATYDAIVRKLQKEPSFSWVAKEIRRFGENPPTIDWLTKECRRTYSENFDEIMGPVIADLDIAYNSGKSKW
jgi:hypothetical protein